MKIFLRVRVERGSLWRQGSREQQIGHKPLTFATRMSEHCSLDEGGGGEGQIKTMEYNPNSAP